MNSECINISSYYRQSRGVGYVSRLDGTVLEYGFGRGSRSGGWMGWILGVGVGSGDLASGMHYRCCQ